MGSRQGISRRHWSAPAWQVFLLAGVLVATGVTLIPVGTSRNVVYVLVGATGVAAIIAGVRRNRPATARSWYLFALGCGSWVVGDVVYSTLELTTSILPFPSLADVFYLGAYPMLAAALLMLGRGSKSGRPITALLDATILVLCLGLVSWVFLIEPTWSASAGPLLGRIVTIAYPLGDLLLLAVVIGIGTARGGWNGAMKVLAGAFAFLVFADTLYEASQFVPALAALVPELDAGWLIAYVLFGSAALHPLMGSPLTFGDQTETALPRGRLAVLMISCLAMPGILIFELATGRPLSSWPVLIVALPLIVLTFTRIGHMVSQLQHQSSRLSLLALADDVTGLANRRRLYERLEEFLDDPRAVVVLTLVDLERFTAINDTLGYRTGDTLLCAVARRLGEGTGPEDVVARVGGATFAVLEVATHAGDDDSAAARLRDELELPYQLPDLLVVSVDVAVGVLRIPVSREVDATLTPSLALRMVDVALSAAKSRPGRVASYVPEMGTDAALTTELVGELSVALERDEIVLHYQPQTELATGRVVGVEALARWQHPTRGLLAPGLFIPALEQTRLIGPFTTYVLDRAIAQGATWRATGLRLTVAVNLSARNLLDPDLVDGIRATLARHDYPAEALELEITESSAMVDPRRSLEVLAALAKLGISLSVDDYGTGHSSLSYLARLPVQTLKIDRSFVTDLLSNRSCAAIVRSTIELARQLDLTVIAEGAEDDSTVLALRDLGCYAVQGYAVARPGPAAQLPAVVDLIQHRLPALLGIDVGSLSSDAANSTDLSTAALRRH
ncbi:MAG: putative bifunctional diguanylate cyclase/phosphodiesterase [Rhodoglobus sp.]